MSNNITDDDAIKVEEYLAAGWTINDISHLIVYRITLYGNVTVAVKGKEKIWKK